MSKYGYQVAEEVVEESDEGEYSSSDSDAERSFWGADKTKRRTALAVAVIVAAALLCCQIWICIEVSGGAPGLDGYRSLIAIVCAALCIANLAAIVCAPNPSFELFELAIVFISAVCFISMLILAALPIETVSHLTDIDTSLVIRPGCDSGKLVAASETLTYVADAPSLMSKGVVRSVTRTLRGEIEAADFKIEGMPPVTNARILKEEDHTPLKTNPNYASEMPTKILTIGFDDVTVLKNATQLQLSLRLKYNSRLFEAAADDCNTPPQNNAEQQCGRWIVSQSGSEVGEDAVPTKNLSVSCLAPAPETCASATQAVDGSFDVLLLRLPNVSLGTEDCPFAWKKSPQSWTWWFGASFLAVGVCLMFFPFFIDVSDNEDGGMGCLLGFCSAGLCCCAVGGVICVIAMAADKVFGA
eukprot:TRINITY_DN36911_c0_g4_i1.p1 TRINITY_DN36911_c0_g4~~TRINITY_DN36911_c0_g4_i1.p1  ORF type:complete len:414 (+),score=55.20 TRINITY_DN36911_c0_g4_i1:139-1380(+)